MQESSTYQAILEEGAERGKLQEARQILLRLGTRRFGTPDTAILQMIEAVPALERLEALIERLPDVESWADLLTTEPKISVPNHGDAIDSAVGSRM